MPANYFVRYVPLLIHMGIAFLLAVAMIVLSQLLGRHRFTRAKFQPYECGMTPVGDAREPFSVKFYMVAMLFILFDVEAVFLYPWAILLKELKMFGFWEMLIYLGVVMVGFFYIWKKGVLDWAEIRRVRSPAAAAKPELARTLAASRAPAEHAEALPLGREKS